MSGAHGVGRAHRAPWDVTGHQHDPGAGRAGDLGAHLAQAASSLPRARSPTSRARIRSRRSPGTAYEPRPLSSTRSDRPHTLRTRSADAGGDRSTRHRERGAKNSSARKSTPAAGPRRGTPRHSGRGSDRRRRRQMNAANVSQRSPTDREVELTAERCDRRLEAGAGPARRAAKRKDGERRDRVHLCLWMMKLSEAARGGVFFFFLTT